MPTGAPDETLYFLDHDGRVFLVQEQGLMRLPTRREVPFPFSEKHTVRVRGRSVVFGSPEDKAAHGDWPWKDDLPFLPGVDSLARSAANLSMARVVSKGAFTRGEEVLLVKPKVGHFAGRWSLPGGYLDYGEGPEECLLRELEEELGVRGEVTRLLHVDSRVVESGLHFLSFLFEGRLLDEAFRLKSDEIEDARWFPIDKAMREVGGALSTSGLEGLRKGARAR